MVTILPMPHEVLLPLCEALALSASGQVWGYVAADNLEMAGYCIIAEPEDEGEPCLVLALECEDKYIADGLLRKGLFPFYEQGVTEYSFVSPPDIGLLPDYIIIGRGSLPQLFRPCPQN